MQDLTDLNINVSINCLVSINLKKIVRNNIAINQRLKCPTKMVQTSKLSRIN